MRALGARTGCVALPPPGPPGPVAAVPEPTPAVNGLRIGLQADGDTLALGDTCTLRVTLANVGGTALRLDAGSGVFGNDFETGRLLWRRNAAGHTARARRLDGT